MSAKKSSRRTKRPQSVTVGDFFEKHHKALKMSLVGSSVGYNRTIHEPTINRPGLALSGFFTYFAYKRVQVVGNSELSFFKHLGQEEAQKRFMAMCRRDIPCLVVARGKKLPEHLVEAANKMGISVFQTTMISMKFINAATLRLEWDFAPTTTEHGCMVDVQGIGILIRGKSGSGKSESVLGLLQRGASLVADDVVRFRLVEDREIIGTAPDLTRFHMEVRGLGLINVSAIFGVGSIRLDKRLDLVITLTPAEDLNDLERVGVEKRYYDILGIQVPHVKLPVAAGRDMAQLIEVASLDQRLKSYGHDSAVEFNERLLQKMQVRE